MLNFNLKKNKVATPLTLERLLEINKGLLKRLNIEPFFIENDKMAKNILCDYIMQSYIPDYAWTELEAIPIQRFETDYIDASTLIYKRGPIDWGNFHFYREHTFETAFLLLCGNEDWDEYRQFILSQTVYIIDFTKFCLLQCYMVSTLDSLEKKDISNEDKRFACVMLSISMFFIKKGIAIEKG